MGKRDTHTHSKYESLYEKSVEKALVNKKIRQYKELSSIAPTTDQDKKKRSPKTKRKMSEYNRFIKENSNKVTGPDRLKKLSKLWNQQKNVQIKNSETKHLLPSRLKSLKSIRSTELSTPAPRRDSNPRLKPRKSAINRSSLTKKATIKSPTICAPAKQPPRRSRRKSDESKHINKSPRPKQSRGMKKKESEKRSVKKDKSPQRSPRQRRLRFFNYVGSPKSNQKPS